MDEIKIALVRWPAQSDVRAELADENRPRLLLVAEDVSAPEVVDPLEDWIREPVDDDEVRARRATLTARARRVGSERPTLDDDGILRAGDRWVALAPVESRLVRSMLANWAALTTRDHLQRAGWPEGVSGRNVLDVHILRLRRRLDPLGLVIGTVRSRGYVLDADGPY